MNASEQRSMRIPEHRRTHKQHENRKDARVITGYHIILTTAICIGSAGEGCF